MILAFFILGFDLALLKNDPSWITKSSILRQGAPCAFSGLNCRMHFHQVVRGANHSWYGLHRARCVVVLERCSCSNFDIASNRCRWTTRLIHLHHAWFNWCQWFMIGILSGKAKGIRCIWFSQLWYNKASPNKWGRITAKFKLSLNQATSFVWTNELWQAKKEGELSESVSIPKTTPTYFLLNPKLDQLEKDGRPNESFLEKYLGKRPLERNSWREISSGAVIFFAIGRVGY